MNYLEPRLGEPCYIWGAGLRGSFCYRKYSLELNILGFIDKNPKIQGKIFWGQPIYSSEILKDDHPFILVSPKDEEMQREIFSQLESYGYTRHKDCFSSFEVEDFVKSQEYKEENAINSDKPVATLKIRSRKEENPVVIMMACNDNYAPLASVAVESVKRFKTKGRPYEVFICSSELSKKNQELLEHSSCEDFYVNCVDITDHIQKISGMFRTFIHITAEGYYRLLIPSLFPEQKNVLYLDCDLVALTDVAPLFDLHLTGYSVAVGKECRTADYNDHIGKEVNLPHDVDFNSGVMVFHVPYWQKNHLLDRCIQISRRLATAMPYQGKVSVYHDQVILNLVCNDNYLRFDFRWNILPYMAMRGDDSMFPADQLVDLKAACEDPWIYHYAGESKPWCDLRMKQGEHFWRVARENVFFEEFFSRLLDSHENMEKSWGRTVDRDLMEMQFRKYIADM